MTEISSRPQFWVNASPRGKRSGFAVLPDGAGGQVTMTVLPKPWSPKPRSVQEYAHVPGSTTHVVMHETEMAAISTTAASVGALAMSLGAASRQQSDLLALACPSDTPLSQPARTDGPFGQLIDLMLLAERGSLMGSPLTFEGAFAPSLLRLLTHERLLALVESLIFRVRPRYSELTETLAMPRGRLHEKSLLLSFATGTPRVQCTFDELTTDTPLLQIMASALRVIGSDRLPPKVAALRPGLQTRAVHLLRYLSGVTLVERETALLTAERLWLGPLDQVWKPAVAAALPVLRDWAVPPEDGSEDTEAMLVHVSTEKFWEQCLEVALESTFRFIAVSRDGQPGEAVSAPPPWVPRAAVDTGPSEPTSSSHPDFMFRASRQVVVADAKYKLQSGGGLSSSDGYQLFAYSHLATLGGRASDVAVILYPTRAGGQPRQTQLERLWDRRYPLWLAYLPFPSRIDIQNQGTWSAYVAQLATVLRDFSIEWSSSTNSHYGISFDTRVPPEGFEADTRDHRGLEHANRAQAEAARAAGSSPGRRVYDTPTEQLKG